MVSTMVTDPVSTSLAPPDLIEYIFENYYKSVRLKSVSTEFTGRSICCGPFLEVNIPSGGRFNRAEGIKSYRRQYSKVWKVHRRVPREEVDQRREGYQEEGLEPGGAWESSSSFTWRIWRPWGWLVHIS